MEGEEHKLDPSTSWHVSTSRPPTSNVYSLMSVRFVMRALASGRLRMLLALQQGRAVRMQARQYALLIATTAPLLPHRLAYSSVERLSSTDEAQGESVAMMHVLVRPPSES